METSPRDSVPSPALPSTRPAIQPPTPPEASSKSGPVEALVRTARKIVVLIVGGTVVLVGVLMIVLPGPAFVVIPLGLGILATEFVWAASMLKQLQNQATSLTELTLGALFRAAARNTLWCLPRKKEVNSKNVVQPPTEPE